MRHSVYRETKINTGKIVSSRGTRSWGSGVKKNKSAFFFLIVKKLTTWSPPKLNFGEPHVVSFLKI